MVGAGSGVGWGGIGGASGLGFAGSDLSIALETSDQQRVGREGAWPARLLTATAWGCPRTAWACGVAAASWRHQPYPERAWGAKV